MILSDTELLAARQRGEIVIDPFDVNQLGGNSYDVRLGQMLRVYDLHTTAVIAFMHRGLDISDELYRYASDNFQAAETNSWRRTWANRGQSVPAVLDAASEPAVIDLKIPDDGIVLVPGILYLASTVEYTENRQHVVYLDGKSSVGRLGISVHKTAGRGDAGNKSSPGFCGHWTMEIDVVQPVRVYAGMPIGQLTYHLVHGEVERAYQSKPGASYLDGRDPMPQPSRLWKKLQRSR